MRYGTALLSLMVMVGLSAATPPEALDRRVNLPSHALDNGMLVVPFRNLGDASNLSIEVVDGPSKGTVTPSPYEPFGGGVRFTYEADPSYFGDTSFTWRLTSDQGTSNTATCIIRRRRPAERGQRVVIVAETNMYEALQSELQRLRQDIQDDGYVCELVDAQGADKAGIWQILKDYYWDTTWLAGAIMIGDIPEAPSVSSDLYNDRMYAELSRFSYAEAELSTGGPGGSNRMVRDIWLSRIDFPGSDTDDWAKSVRCTRYALDANHRYRTAQQRMPAKIYRGWNSTTPGYSVDPVVGPFEADHDYYTLWPNASGSYFKTSNGTGGGDAQFAAGGAYLFKDSHGNQNDHVLTFPLQIQVVAGSSCYEGQRTRWHLFYRDGACVLADGHLKVNSTTNFELRDNTNYGVPVDATIVALADGASWGSMIHPGVLYNEMIFGDLTLRPNMAPANVLPTIDDLNASAKTIDAGESVTFQVTVSDADAGNADNPELDYEYRLEYFVLGYDAQGDIDPGAVHTLDQVSGSDSYTHRYTQPGVYTVRVMVSDEWYGKAWKDVKITVNEGTFPVRSISMENLETWVWECAPAGTTSYPGTTTLTEELDPTASHWLRPVVGGDG